jgi:hypothetical protein
VTPGRPSISRALVIVLALGAMTMRIGQQAWVEAAGLGALAAGLLALQFSAGRPSLRPVAWVAFSVTLVAMGIVFVRMQNG